MALTSEMPRALGIHARRRASRAAKYYGSPWRAAVVPDGLPADAPAMVTQRTYKTDDEVSLKVAGGSNFLEAANAGAAKITRPTYGAIMVISKSIVALVNPTRAGSTRSLPSSGGLQGLRVHACGPFLCTVLGG